MPLQGVLTRETGGGPFLFRRARTRRLGYLAHVAVTTGDSPEQGASQGGRPPRHRWPQIILEGVLRRSREVDVITFTLPPILRLFEVSVVVTLPRDGKTKAPVYVRFFLNKDAGDPPGSVVIE